MAGTGSVNIVNNKFNSCDLQKLLESQKSNTNELKKLVQDRGWPIIVFSDAPGFLHEIGQGFTAPPEHFLVPQLPQLNIQLTDERYLKIAMTTVAFKNLLEKVDEEFLHFVINGKPTSTSQYNCPTGKHLVWSSIMLTPSELKLIRDKFPNSEKMVEEIRYGSVVLRFPYKSVAIASQQCFKLGTRVFLEEYSQVILVDQISQEISDWHVAFDYNSYHKAEAFNYGRHQNRPEGLKNRTIDPNEHLNIIYPLERIDDLGAMNWPLTFCNEQEEQAGWTNPELAFVGSLKIPIDQCTIEFVQHVMCRKETQVYCQECLKSPEYIKQKLAKSIAPFPTLRERLIKLKDKGVLSPVDFQYIQGIIKEAQN